MPINSDTLSCNQKNSDTLSTTATQGLQKAEGGLPFTQSISSLMTSRAGIMPGTAYTPFAIDG